MAEIYLYPDSTIASAWSGLVGAATAHEAIDDTAGAEDGDTSYVQGSGAAWVDLTVGFQPAPDGVEYTNVDLIATFNNAGAGANQEFDFGTVIGGVNYLKGAVFVVSATYTSLTMTMATNPATGGLWTKPQLDAFVGILRTQDAAGKPVDSVRCTSLKLKLTYQPLSAEITAERGRASARLRRFGEEIPQAVITYGPEALDLEVMDNVEIQHPAGPWEETIAARQCGRLHSIRSIGFNPNTLAVTLKAWDQRRFLCTAWDTARTARGTSIDEQGVARMSAGAIFASARASDMWVMDCESQLVVAKGTNQRGYDFVGTLADAAATRYGAALIEGAVTNLLLHSSAVAGSTAVAALTVTGASGTFAEESSPTQPLFDTSVSTYAYKFTAGSPHSADKRAAWPLTAIITANTLVRFSIDYMNTGTVSADRLGWRIQRNADSNYWNDSTGAWQAGAVDNLLPLVATRSKDTRAFSKVINVGGSNTRLTLSLVALSGGTASRVDRVYHVQIENSAWPTSRIVTGAATVTRASQLDSWTNLSGARSIRAAGGTALFHGIVPWDAADITAKGATPRVFDVTYDASNWIRFYYDGTNLTLSIRASGVTTTATKAWTAVRGEYVYLAARWTSTLGEEGAARTHDVFIDGVKGDSATRAADPTESTSPLYVGCDSSGNQWGGHLFEREFLQVVLTDAEIAAEAE